MTVSADPGVIVHQEGGEAFLLHVTTGRYFGLNRTGLAVWEAVVAGHDPVAEVLGRWPTVAPDVARADVKKLVDALLAAGLARESERGAEAPPGA